MKPTLQRYISKKLDGVEGELPRLKKMFSKSFSARNFRLFWNAWNPIYTYVLTYYVYSPLRKKLNKSIALVLTFLINGLFHDIVVLLVLKETSFNVSKLFILYGLLVLLESKIQVDIKGIINRVIYNMVLLIGPVLFIILMN